jgi:hypothetical protein
MIAVRGEVVLDAGEDRGARDAVQQRHPVEHHGRGEHAEQEVLHARFVAPQVPLAPRRQHVGRDGQELEGHEDAHEVAARGDHHHPEHGREEEHVVLPVVVVALLHVVRRHEDDDVGGEQEEALEHKGEVVDDVGAVEHHAGGLVGEGEGEDRDEGREDADSGERRQRPLAIVLDEQVEEQQEHDDAAEDDLGREGVVVEVGLVEGLGEDGCHRLTRRPATPHPRRGRAP